MNIAELGKALREIGIPDRLLAIGGRAEYSWCVEPSSDGTWEVYWYERGNKNDLTRLRDESQACYYLLGRLTYSRLLGGTLVAREADNSRFTPEVSQDLVEWARAAGYSLTRGGYSRATILWSDPGGETRFYIRRRFDGHLVLTLSERASDEWFELSAPAAETLERHLLGLLGSDARSRKGLPRLRLPTKPDAVATGFRITDKDAHRFFSLTDKDGRTIASARDKSTLVELSHLVSNPLADIIASY